MGNQCTPRSFQRSTCNAQNIKKQPRNIQKGLSLQIYLAPQETESDYLKTQTLKKSPDCQKGSEISRSEQSLKTKVREIAQTGDSYQTQTVKEKILQNMQTLPTFSDDKKSTKKQQVEQKLDSSQLSKRNIKIDIETPSQVRDSLISAWNKSNFHESQLFKTIKYDEIFRPVVESNAYAKK